MQYYLIPVPDDYPMWTETCRNNSWSNP